MDIKDMFLKPIDRNIQGVIKVGQTDDENIFQELDEYVVTDELRKHFSDFFEAYSKSIDSPTDDIGVWISGFFGSGKSHFLKILSYILNSDLKVKDPNNPNVVRKPIDFFTEDNKIQDSIVIGDMKKASEVSTDVILFNIDSKSSNSESSKDKILDVFVKVFNEMRGYSTEVPFLAHLEKKLDDENKYDEFKEVFKEINGKEWVDIRDEYYYMSDDIVKSIVQIGYMSENEANNWVDKAEYNYNISIEKFADEIEEYCLSKGNNHHIVFLVDEIGQYIGDDANLMLNLQSLTEDLGTKCRGKAWIVVTSQQNIDDLVNVKGQDFSKIQGRFKTRLSLSSANVDEVIRKRILAKNSVALETLKADYPNKESILKNIFTFKDSAEMKNYVDADDFASIYPFVPYQFNLLQSVLTSIREHGASGKHLAEGERSMLALFQESAINIENEKLGVLISFNNFYNPLSKFIDHTHSSVIIKAGNNDHLKHFDVEVLKALFLIKYIKELKANIENITTLMINDIDIDKIELRQEVEESLKRLVRETLVQKNGEIYSFLTNEEQDVNREIKNENIEYGDILERVGNIVFTDIFDIKKYSYDKRHDFSFNRAIDDKYIGQNKYDIGVRVITSYYDFKNSKTGQTTFDNDLDIKKNTLKALSGENNEAIFSLISNTDLMDEIREILQIENYLRKNIEMNSVIRLSKQEELKDKKSRIEILLNDSLKESDIYVNGNQVNIPEKNVKDRLDETLYKLITEIYNKLDYMGGFRPDKNDILKVLNDSSQKTLNHAEHPANNALNELEDYIKRRVEIHDKPSLKSILNRFSSEPYGFTDLDIEWLIAKLFSDKRIRLSINSENISLLNTKKETILDYLTKTQYSEKILLSIQEKISSNYIRAVKDVFKELFNKSINKEDAELIQKEFISESKDERDKIKDYLSRYQTNSNYPGENNLKEFDEFLFEINNKSLYDFYKFIFSKQDDLLDLNDDIHPVIEFFDGNQKEIFDNAIEVNEIYESNKNFINNEEIEQDIESIQKILEMPNPYSKIKDIPSLIEDFNRIYDDIIDDEKFVPNNDIENNRDEIISLLNEDYEYKDDLKNEFENNVNKIFNELSEKLEKSRDISTIRGITDESINLNEIYKDKIIQFKKDKNIQFEKEGETPTVLKPLIPDYVDIDITKIISGSKITIKSNEDLNDFIDKITSEIKKELDDEKIVNLKL